MAQASTFASIAHLLQRNCQCRHTALLRTARERAAAAFVSSQLDSADNEHQPDRISEGRLCFVSLYRLFDLKLYPCREQAFVPRRWDVFPPCGSTLWLLLLRSRYMTTHPKTPFSRAFRLLSPEHGRFSAEHRVTSAASSPWRSNVTTPPLEIYSEVSLIRRAAVLGG